MGKSLRPFRASATVWRTSGMLVGLLASRALPTASTTVMTSGISPSAAE